MRQHSLACIMTFMTMFIGSTLIAQNIVCSGNPPTCSNATTVSLQNFSSPYQYVTSAPTYAAATPTNYSTPVPNAYAQPVVSSQVAYQAPGSSPVYSNAVPVNNVVSYGYAPAYQANTIPSGCVGCQPVNSIPMTNYQAVSHPSANYPVVNAMPTQVYPAQSYPVYSTPTYSPSNATYTSSNQVVQVMPQGRNTTSSQYVSTSRVGSAGGLAQRKAQQAANSNLKGHVGGGLGGAKYEGVGWSTISADSAVQACCYWGTRPVAEIGVVRGSDGWYACVLYN